jgi:hypothetical protein
VDFTVPTPADLLAHAAEEPEPEPFFVQLARDLGERLSDPFAAREAAHAIERRVRAGDLEALHYTMELWRKTLGGQP